MLETNSFSLLSESDILLARSVAISNLSNMTDKGILSINWLS